jgi:hypothetical protein
MIIQQAKAPVAVQKIYSDKIAEASERLEILRRNLAQLQKYTESPSVMAARQQSFNELTEMGIDAFWMQASTRINQMLHRLFGKRRLIVNQGEIKGLGPATQWR